MSRTIEAIMRHMAAPSNGVANQRNGTEKLEGEFTVNKRHYVWSEARFVWLGVSAKNSFKNT